MLKSPFNAPWYVRYADLHRDLGVNSVTIEIAKIASSHDLRHSGHVNEQAAKLIEAAARENRLKRKMPFDLAR